MATSTQSTLESQTEVPRDPSTYRPGVHFLERLKDRYDDHRRHLDGEIVRECITEGEATYQGSTDLYYEADVGGVRYRLVVNPDIEKVITAYPVEITKHRALESGRWSRQQLDDIEAFLADDDAA